MSGSTTGGERPMPGAALHLVGIGGVGMSALAGLLQAAGYRVTGSDEAVYPPASTLLERLGIEVRRGYRAEHVADADGVVIGNAVTRANAEAVAATARALPLYSMPGLIGELFLAERRSLVVAGTHGKTTSSAMLAWVLDCAGRRPGFLVGGAPLNLGANYALGEGEDFVIEGDEYDSAFFDKRPKFIHYRPRGIILTGVEFDHADIYRDLEHVKSAFRDLMTLLPPDAPLAVASDFPHAVDVARVSHGRPMLFGDDPGSSWRAVGLRDDGARTVFGVEADGRRLADVRLQVLGAINARNALGVFALATALGLGAEEIVAGLESFRGVRRRQELVGERHGITVIDDFAHHPTAIAGTLEAVRARYRGRRVIAVFEPRSNTSRRRVFQDAFAEALADADQVVLSAVFEKPNDPLPPAERLSTADLVAELGRRAVDAVVLPSPEAIAARLAMTTRSGDVIVVMSNGAFGGLPRRLLELVGAPAGDTSGPGAPAP